MEQSQLPLRTILFMVMAISFILVACSILTLPPTPPSTEEPPNQPTATNPAGPTKPPATLPASPTQPPTTPSALNGLYVGRYPNGDKAVAYLFKPSGAVAHDFYESVVDPDDAASWPTKEVYVEKEAKEQGYEPYRVDLGEYQLGGDRILLNTQEQYVDSIRQVKFRETVYGDIFDQKNETLSFQAFPGFSSVVIDGAVLIRQGDLTGMKISGDFWQVGMSETILMSFTSGGQFSGSFSAIYHGPGESTIPSHEENGSGQYQVQGNEIIFRYSDGTNKRYVFADLGRDNNRKILAIGGWILEER